MKQAFLVLTLLISNAVFAKSVQDAFTEFYDSSEINSRLCGVNTQKFGLQAVKNSPYGVRGLANPLLITYMQKNLGMHRRQGLVQGYSANLTASPTSLTQYLNSNFWVGGVAAASQPVYVDTLATYATNINTAIFT